MSVLRTARRVNGTTWQARYVAVLLPGLWAMTATALVAGAPAPEVAPFWCESTDAGKLNLTVVAQDGRHFMTDLADYRPADKACYYFVNWDLQGTQADGKRIRRLEVEPNSLYLVHLYEISRPRKLADFWSDDPGKRACVAFVWVGGEEPAAGARRRPAGANATLTEVRESASWFGYRKGERLPVYSRRFPEFRLPDGKLLSLAMSRSEDTFENCLRHGVTHFQSGGGESGKLPRDRRLMTLPTGFFNQGIGESPSDDPHISPTENSFMRSPAEHAVSKASIAAGYDYMFLDEEFWHNDYQPETIQRLCLFAREARRINSTLKLADFWNPPPYHFSFLGRDRWTAESMSRLAASHYGDTNAAMRSTTPALMRQVTVHGKQTSLAQELSAVSICVYFDNLFGFIDQYGTFSNDLFIPTAIHNTRINRRMTCNQSKPLIWFGMEILEGKYNHPRIAYPTRTTDPPGTAIFHERLPVSPNFNEAVALFGLLEADGAYLWEPHGPSDGDPNGIFSTLKYCRDYKDDRGEWRPDVPGTPIGEAKTWYPAYLYSAPDYYALGAWKYAQIADIVTQGTQCDFEYSTDGGRTWYIPPANGAAMADVIREKRPIVTGGVSREEVAIIAFNPFQGVADSMSLLVRHENSVFALELFGTRARVYRGRLK